MDTISTVSETIDDAFNGLTPTTCKFANHIGWSDVNPYEIVRVVTDKTIEIKAMKSEKDPTWLPDWVVGGFSGVCTNQQSQKWIITSDENAVIFKIRLHKSGAWKDKHGAKYKLGNEPMKFYDFNF